MPDFVTIVEAATAGLELFQATKKINSKVKMLLKLVREGYIRVVILGPGGVGKTSLAKFLSGNKNYRDTGYIESARDEEFKIGKNVLGKYWVAPGQERRIERYWPQIYRAITKGMVKCVINIVAYGYHSIDSRLDYKDVKDIYKDGMSEAEFLEHYLNERRNDELKIVNELKHRLKDTKDRIHMITIVTKQDLWWKEKEEVQDFYTRGEYLNAIREIETTKGQANFEHTFLSISLLSNNFFIGKNPFKLVAEGYDENTRIANLNSLINQLEAYL